MAAPGAARSPRYPHFRHFRFTCTLAPRALLHSVSVVSVRGLSLRFTGRCGSRVSLAGTSRTNSSDEECLAQVPTDTALSRGCRRNRLPCSRGATKSKTRTPSASLPSLVPRSHWSPVTQPTREHYGRVTYTYVSVYLGERRTPGATQRDVRREPSSRRNKKLAEPIILMVRGTRDRFPWPRNERRHASARCGWLDCSPCARRESRKTRGTMRDETGGREVRRGEAWRCEARRAAGGRDGTERDGTERDGTGRDGMGRDETEGQDR